MSFIINNLLFFVTSRCLFSTYQGKVEPKSSRTNKNATKTGVVLEFSDQVAIISGIPDLFLGELIYFSTADGNSRGFVFNIEGSFCKVPMVYGDESKIAVGDRVFRTNRLVQTKCGFGVLGDIINPIGDTILSSKGRYFVEVVDNLFHTFWLNIEMSASGIVNRSTVTVPFMTGIASIDCFFPIGCGQRELIIGDHGSGKTSLAITAIINQSMVNNRLCGFWRNISVISEPYSLFFPCIYVAIGAKRSEIIRLRKVLLSKEALHYTCIVFTGSDEFAALQFLAPFSGCSIGEWFMNNGYNAVVVYDDLSSHATAYRQMALLLRRPPGREAYPGDIFYLHSRLLERSAQLITGGSLTGLPIVRTMGNDISGYIPTNVISITDGQLFLLISLMNKGIRPAVDLSLSVSRVGSAAQYKVMSVVSKRVKSMYALYKVFYGVSKLGSDDPEVNLHVNRGTKLLEFFKQAVYHTYSLFDQVTVMYILTLNFSDRIAVDSLNLFFRLLRSSTLARSVHVDSTDSVLLISRANELEALLIIFGLELVIKSLDDFADRFCTYFELNLSRKY